MLWSHQNVSAYSLVVVNGSINVLSHHEKLLVDYHLFIESFSLCFPPSLTHSQFQVSSFESRVSRGKRMFTSHNRMLNKTIFDAFEMYTTPDDVQNVCEELKSVWCIFQTSLFRYEMLKNWIPGTLFKTLMQRRHFHYSTSVNRWQIGT